MTGEVDTVSRKAGCGGGVCRGMGGRGGTYVPTYIESMCLQVHSHFSYLMLNEGCPGVAGSNLYNTRRRGEEAVVMNDFS